MTASQGRRWRRALAWCLLAGMAVLAAAYATFPWWVQSLVPRLAQRAGVEQITLAAGRPDWRSVRVHDLDLATTTTRITARDIRVAYSWSALLRGQIDQIVVAHLDASVRPDNAPPAAADAPMVPQLPVDVVAIRDLVLRFPATGFLGRGQATLDDSGLVFAMQGQAPEAAARLSVRATLTRAGVFDVVVGEAGRSDAPFLRLDGTLAGSALVVEGAANLTGFPLTLASDIARVPPGYGAVRARFETRLPWPLPESLAWDTLRAQIRDVAIDWTDDADRWTVQVNRGHARLEQGAVEATVDGQVRLLTDRTEPVLVFPADYVLKYRNGVLTGGAGLVVRAALDQQSVVAQVNTFALDSGDAIRLDVDATLNLSRQTRAATARLLGRFGLGAVEQSGARQFDAGIRWPDRPTDTFALRGRLTPDAAMIDGRFDLDDDTFGVVGDLIDSANGEGRIAGEFGSTLALPVVAEDISFALSKLDVNWRSADQRLRVKNIAGSAVIRGRTVKAKLGGALSYKLGERLIDVSLPPDYALHFDGRVLRGGAGATFESRQENEQIAASVHRLMAVIDKTPQLDLVADVDATLVTSSARGRLDAAYRAGEVSNTRSNTALTFNGSIDAAGQNRDVTVAAQLALNGDDLGVDGTLATGEIGEVPFRVQMNTRTTAGSLTATKAFEFFAPAAALFVPDWAAVYDLDRGQVDADLRVHWASSQPVRAELALTLREVAAHYESYRFDGIAGQLQLTSDSIADSSAWQLQPTTLGIESLDVGIPLTELEIGLNRAGDLVGVAHARAKVLGGELSMSPFDYAIDAGAAAFAVTLTGIDLAEVLALEGDNVTGSGTLDGTLPVVMTGNQPSVTDGVMRARPPGGVIELSSSLASGSGQAELNFALTALQDFRYSTLDTDIDYAPNGDLRLGVSLKGRNPAVEKNRPIHYNLNITENIPVLLQSLRLKDQLNKDIEERLGQ